MHLEQNKNSAKQWWRWILVPFLPLIGAQIASWIAQVFFIKFLGFQEGSLYDAYIAPTSAIVPIISSVITGITYSWLSFNLAPTKKSITVGAVAILY